MLSRLEWGLLGVAYGHVLLAPHTKVEESFSLHAVRDIIRFGFNSTSLSLVSPPPSPTVTYGSSDDVSYSTITLNFPERCPGVLSDPSSSPSSSTPSSSLERH